MSTSFSLLRTLRQSLTLAVVAGSAAALAGAQTQTPAQAADTVEAQPAQFQFALPMSHAMVADDDAAFSSSSDSAGAASTEAQTNLASLEKNFAVPGIDAQYGRRRYGATRYRGSNTNADGSEKYTAYAGVGFGLPITANSNYLTTGYGFQVGVGRNFNRHFGLNVEFGYDHFGLTGQTISNQSYIYFGDTVAADNGLDANSHIWNFSLQPTYQIYSGQGLGAYVTGGVGFYHKVANFTLPEEEEVCEFYYCADVYVDANADHYTSNAPGFDGGVGLTYKFSRFANERLFAEVRYVYVDNKYRPGYTAANIDSYTTGTNFFPQNSQTTSYIPIKFGVRF